MQDAQTLDNHHGKIVRIWPDGSIPKDNPFVGNDDALDEIWSYGHRNVKVPLFILIRASYGRLNMALGR